MSISQLVNEQAENAVIGAMLVRNEEIPRVMDVLEPEDFHNQNNQLVSRLVFEMHSEGLPVDAVLIGVRLAKELGNADKAVLLLDRILEAVPCAMNAVYYAEIVKDFAERRRVYFLCRKLVKKLPDTKFSVGALLERFRELTGGVEK